MSIASSDEARSLVQNCVRDPRKLPPIPAVVQQVARLMDDGRSGAAEIAKVIGRDESITAQLLRIANSAFYGMPGRISTISHAVTMLGFEQIRILLLGVSLFESYGGRDPKVIANRKLVWRHSFSCARWAQAIAKNSRYDPVEEAFIAGLLHDVGKVVLATAAPQEFAAALEMSRKEGLETYEAERSALGIDHMETGGAISQHWNFPPPFHDCIVMHHGSWIPEAEDASQAKKKDQRLLAIVRVANTASHIFAEQASEGEPGFQAEPPPDSDVLVKLVDQVDALLRIPDAAAGIVEDGNERE